jgi:hypothetical protein
MFFRKSSVLTGIICAFRSAPAPRNRRSTKLLRIWGAIFCLPPLPESEYDNRDDAIEKLEQARIENQQGGCQAVGAQLVRNSGQKEVSDALTSKLTSNKIN